MFWVVDSLIMRKYKQKDTLDISGSMGTPQARRTEESQVRPGMQTCGMICVFYHNPVTEHHIA